MTYYNWEEEKFEDTNSIENIPGQNSIKVALHIRSQECQTQSKEKCDATMMELLQEEIGGDAGNYYKYEGKVNKVKLQEVKNLSRLKGHSFVALVPY